MKRRHRRPILDIDGELSNSPLRNSYVNVQRSEPNGSSNNPLKGLLGQYNSDSEAEEMQQPNKLDDKVNDFLKEIQSIAPENPSALSNESVQGKYPVSSEMAWQECFDESTGYPYYWHTKTNQVTWEMPPEYRIWKDKSQLTQHNLQMTHWPGVSANAYPKPQTEIPEGMIPKEVVARNRNRQAGIQQTPVPTNLNKPTGSLPSHLRDDDSDDGKIEMITSFGNDESEESDSDANEEEIPDNKSKKVPQRKASDYPSREKKLEVKSSTKQVEIGPYLPPEMMSKIKSKLEKDKKISAEFENFLQAKSSGKSVSSVINSESISDEDDILRRLKTQAKLLQSVNKSVNSSESLRGSNSRGESPEVERNKQSGVTESEKREERTQPSGSEFKVSLVPGYEDDSDNEEEIPPPTEVKPLFPIVEYQSDKPLPSVSSDGIVKRVETRQTDTGCIRIFEYRNTESGKTDSETKEPIKETDSSENCESETRLAQSAQDISKVNKFLENLETPTKAFQRKKRIAFDVLPNRPKVPETQEVPVVEEVQSTVNEGEKFGFGLQKEKDETSNESTESKPAEVSAKPDKELVNFVKGETLTSSTAPKEEVKSIPAAENKEFKYLTEMISEKLKFLAEGCQMVSAVQVMAIQLQTLLEAWEAGDLKQTYLHQWLTLTGRELSRLEQTAAPPGWECQWDRYGILTESISSPNTPSLNFMSQTYSTPSAS